LFRYYFRRTAAIVPASLHDALPIYLWADGRDVSWIWDADFESLVERGVAIVAGGIRAYDVAVRIKYASGSVVATETDPLRAVEADRKSTRLNSSHLVISYAVFCLKK